MKKGTSIRQVSPLQFAGFVVLRNEDGSVESVQLDYDIDLEWEVWGSRVGGLSNGL